MYLRIEFKSVLGVLHDIYSFSPGSGLMEILETCFTCCSFGGEMLFPGGRFTPSEVVEIRRDASIEPVVEIFEEFASYFAEIFLELIEILWLVLNRLSKHFSQVGCNLMHILRCRSSHVIELVAMSFRPF